jgi:hypothetical protein
MPSSPGGTAAAAPPEYTNNQAEVNAMLPMGRNRGSAFGTLLDVSREMDAC